MMRKLMMILAGAMMLTACNPSKVTDPSDPRFDSTKFRFEDYKDVAELHEAIMSVFPVGTGRQKVDSILINSANYSYSDMHQADLERAGFNKTLRLSEQWNSQNYFVDYSSSPNLRERQRGYSVRILFSGSDDVVLEVIVDKLDPKAAPMFFVKEMQQPRNSYDDGGDNDH